MSENDPKVIAGTGAIGCDTQILVAKADEIIEAINENTRQRGDLVKALDRLGDKIGAYLADLVALLSRLTQPEKP